MQRQLVVRTLCATRLVMNCTKDLKIMVSLTSSQQYFTTRSGGIPMHTLAQHRQFSLTPLAARDERRSKKEDKNSMKNALRFEPSGALKAAVGYSKLIEGLDSAVKGFQDELFVKLRLRIDLQLLSEIEVRVGTGGDRKSERANRKNSESAQSQSRVALQTVATITQKSTDLFIVDLEANPTLVGAVRDAVRASGLAVTDDAQRSALIVKQPPVTAELRRTLAKQSSTIANNAIQRINKLVQECERKRRNLESGKTEKHSIDQDELVLLRDHLIALSKRYHEQIEAVAKQKEREILNG